jgi:dipeptidyl aminopeptidase/acylaminoacyl peptidase
MNLSLPPIIPRDDLFGNPEKASPQISPDGATLAYLAPDEGVLNVWVRTSGLKNDRAITRDRKRGIRQYTWAYDGTHLLYLQDKDGDENWHVWAVNLSSGDIRNLTPFANVQAQLIAVDPRFPDEILVSLNARDERFHDVHRIRLASGEAALEIENPGDIVGWVADPEMKVRAAYAACDDGGFELRVRSSPDAEWRPLVHWGPDEEGHPYGFSADGNSLYIGSSLGADTQELRLIDAQTGLEETLASNPEVDLSDAIVHPTEHRIQAVGFNKDWLRWTVLDPDIAEDIAFLQEQKNAEVRVTSRNLADDTWVVLYTLDKAPAAYYVYHRSEKRLSPKCSLLLSRRATASNCIRTSRCPRELNTRTFRW